MVQGLSLNNVDPLTTLNWRIPFGAPIVSGSVNALMWWFILRHESLAELIRQGQMVIAEKQLQRIYEFKDS